MARAEEQSMDIEDVSGVTDDRLGYADDYDVQFFGFCPRSLMNGMYNGMWDYLKDAVATLKEYILSTFGSAVNKTELEEQCQNLRQAAIDRLNRKFDTAETYLLRNVLDVPAHIILPEDKLNVQSPCSEAEMLQLDHDIKNVTDRIVAVKYANALLQERLLKQQQDGKLTELRKIHSDVSSQSQQMIHAADNIQHLQSLLDRCKVDLLKD